jgi:HSP20 family protein
MKQEKTMAKEQERPVGAKEGGLLDDEFASEPIGAEVAEDGDWLSSGVEGQLAVDVYQTKAEIVIKAPIAGVNPNDISIAITDEVVTIKGERKEIVEVERENYYAQECYWGAFSRSVILPVSTVSDKAEATFDDGILTIRIPKADQAKTKIVKIRTVPGK